MDIDVVSAAFEEVGQPVEFGVLPWKRIMKLMQISEIAGGMSCSWRENRQSYMLFSDHISVIRQAAISKNTLDTSKIKTLSDLKNYSVTTISGWGIADQLTNHQVEYIASKDIRSALVNVLHRGTDALYASEIPTRYSAKKMGEQDNIKATYLDDVPPTNLHLCVSKGYPNSENIVTEFNRGLKIIKENGKYQKIQAEYF